MPPSPPPEVYALFARDSEARPEFTLDVTNRRLCRNGEAISLVPKSFDVLALLVQRGGSLVRRDEFIDIVWNGAFVTESVLKGAINEIRHALGDPAKEPLYVRTRHKYGYSFVGRIERIDVVLAREDGDAGVVTQAGQGSTSVTTSPRIQNSGSRESDSSPGSAADRALVPGYPPLAQTIFLGREDDLRVIRHRLLGSDLTNRFRQVIVTGVPGIGKSALAAVLSREPEILRQYPDGVLWTCLDKTPVLASAIANWGLALGNSDVLRVATIGDASDAVRQDLHNKRMLLMVDDVWDEGHGAVFQRMLTGNSALIFTTRLPRVAEALSQNARDIHVLRPLREADALQLVTMLAPGVAAQFPHECTELVRDLECLPLAIHVAARLLRKRVGRGLDARALLQELRTGAGLMDANAPADRATDGMIPTVRALLTKSTDLLDEKMRQCFVDLGAFAPKPASFDLEAMKHVCDVPDASLLADELIDCGLLEPLGNGRFQIHALLVAHANALSVTGSGT